MFVVATSSGHDSTLGSGTRDGESLALHVQTHFSVSAPPHQRKHANVRKAHRVVDGQPKVERHRHEDGVARQPDRPCLYAVVPQIATVRGERVRRRGTGAVEGDLLREVEARQEGDSIARRLLYPTFACL